MAVWRISQLLPQEHLATCCSVRECKLGEIIVWMGCFVTENTHRSGLQGLASPGKVAQEYMASAGSRLLLRWLVLLLIPSEKPFRVP